MFSQIEYEIDIQIKYGVPESKMEKRFQVFLCWSIRHGCVASQYFLGSNKPSPIIEVILH